MVGGRRRGLGGRARLTQGRNTPTSPNTTPRTTKTLIKLTATANRRHRNHLPEARANKHYSSLLHSTHNANTPNGGTHRPRYRRFQYIYIFADEIVMTDASTEPPYTLPIYLHVPICSCYYCKGFSIRRRYRRV